MIDQFQDKIEEAGLMGRVTGRELSHVELHVLLPQRFDGILSAFAGLNTVPDLRGFAVNAARLLRPGGHLIALIKPQFEVGKDRVGKGGVVRDPDLHREVRERIESWLNGLEGWTVLGTTESPIKGPEGNTEFLVAAIRS